MWSRLAASRPFAFSPKILAGYRNHGTSETARLARTGARLADQVKAFEMLADRLPPGRRAEARAAFRRYLLPGPAGENPAQEAIIAAVRQDVAHQIADGSMPVRWYFSAPVAALWAKWRRCLSARNRIAHDC